MLITFDLDEVLIQNPFGSGVFPHVRQVVSEQSGADPADVRKAILQEARQRQLRGDAVAAYDWDDIVRHVSDGFGVGWTESIAQVVERHCVEPHIGLHPGAREILAELQAAGHTLRALTNGFHKYQYPVLRALGIADFFERIVTPDQAGAAKPNPAFFEAARADAQLPHIHIGDHAIHDVWGANRVGAVSVWINPRLPEEWDDRTPARRAAEPGLIEWIEKGIAADLCPECYPDLKPEDARPKYAIRHLSELAAIVSEVAAATGA